MMDIWISSKQREQAESESHLRVRFYRGSYDHKISDGLRFRTVWGGISPRNRSLLRFQQAVLH